MKEGPWQRVMKPAYSMQPRELLKRLFNMGPVQAIWKSIFRQGYPDADRTRLQVMTNTFLFHWHPGRVKAHTLKPSYTLGLGLISFFLYVLLIGTGGILMFFYIPASDHAYTDIQNMHTTIDFGALMRNMHRWGAHLMVLAVLAHMCRVFYTGGYKEPRELNWVMGVIILVLTLLLSFTGYLLVWDQLSFWAITVGTNMAGAPPFIGNWVRLLLLGAPEVGQPALLRFYVLHLAVLPIALTALLGIHFWRVRKDGGLSAPLKKEAE